MRRLATAVWLVVGLVCAGSVTPASAQQPLFYYVGFDYEYPIVVPNTFGGLGNGYNGVGEVPVISPPLVADYTNNQYTYYLTGLTATTRTVVPPIVVIDYTGPGTLTVYEDSKTSGTAFDYGTNPPNGTAPPSFVDGTPIIVGSVTNFRFVYNTNTGSGSYDSDFTVVGGSQFGSIPASQQSGWQFAGTTSNSISIPQGYEHQVVGQTFLGPPTATTSESWGQIKRRYR